MVKDWRGLLLESLFPNELINCFFNFFYRQRVLEETIGNFVGNEYF